MTELRRAIPVSLLLLAAIPAQHPAIGARVDLPEALRWLGDRALERERGKPLVVQVLEDESPVDYSVNVLQGQLGDRVQVAAVSPYPAARLARRIARWNDAPRYPIAVDDHRDFGSSWSERVAADREAGYAVLDGQDRIAWWGPLGPTDEPLRAVLDDLLAGRHEADFERQVQDRLRTLPDTRGSKAEVQAAIARMIEAFPTAPESWLVRFQVRMKTVPGRPELEQQCVDEAFTALADHPVALAEFVHRGLAPLAPKTPHLARARGRLQAARDAHPQVRSLEWALLRACVADRQVAAARASALRLLEHARGRAGELIRIADELVDPPLGLSFAEVAGVGPLVIERERLYVHAAVRGDAAAARGAAERLIAAAGDDREFLLELTRELLEHPDYRGRQGELALLVGDALADVAGWESREAWLARAEARHQVGRHADALEFARRARALAKPQVRRQPPLRRSSAPRRSRRIGGCLRTYGSATLAAWPPRCRAPSTSSASWRRWRWPRSGTTSAC